MGNRDEGMFDSAKRLNDKKPISNDPYLSPCFESLCGAFYALRMAEEVYSYTSRKTEDYPKEVRAEILEYLIKVNELPVSPKSGEAFDIWVSGFYFNGTLFRLVFALERTLAIFACFNTEGDDRAPKPPEGWRKHLPNCAKTDGAKKKDEYPTYAKIRKLALSRLKHFESRPLKFPVIEKICKLTKKEYTLEKVVTEKNFLAAIRWDVNQRKHSIGGFHRVLTCSSGNKSWPDLVPEKQFYYAKEMFQLVVSEYCEVWGAINGAKPIFEMTRD